MKQRSGFVKTLKSIKITAITHIIYCILCIVSFCLILIAHFANSLVCYEIGIFSYAYIVFISSIIIPLCFLINISNFIKERKIPEQRILIGKEWKWIFIWSALATSAFITTFLPLIGI